MNEKHPGGRPRTVSLPPEEMIKLGEEMINWVKLNNPLHIKEWYSLQKGIIFKDWDTMSKKPEFVPYYEQAMNFISLNYINGKVNPSISQRFLRIYFKDLKDSEDQDAREDAIIKKDIISATPQSVVVHVNKDLGCGLDVSATTISNPPNQGSK